MLYQYLQPAVAESVWCSHYRMMLLQHDPAERYKLGFIHRWPEMCWVYFSEADPVDWRITIAAMHFSLSTVAVWEAEPVCAVHHRVHSLLPLCDCLGWNCECQLQWALLLHSFAYGLFCKGCPSGHLTFNWTQHEKATDRLLGMLHRAYWKKDKVSLGCFKSLRHGFTFQAYSMLHTFNLSLIQFSQVTSKMIWGRGHVCFLFQQCSEAKDFLHWALHTTPAVMQSVRSVSCVPTTV